MPTSSLDLDLSGAYGGSSDGHVSTLERLRARRAQERAALLAEQKRRQALQGRTRPTTKAAAAHAQVDKAIKKATTESRTQLQRRRALEAKIVEAKTLTDLRKCRYMLQQALERSYVTASVAAVLRSKLQDKAQALLRRRGYTTLTSAQKVKLVGILRLLRARRISSSQAAAMAAQAAPAVKAEWTEHAALAAEEAPIAAAATLASPSTATPSETAAASITTDTTAASGGAGFEPSSAGTLDAVYSTSTDLPATAAAPVDAATAPATDAGLDASVPDADLDAGTEDIYLEEEKKPNLKLYAGLALAGAGIWYVFFRPNSRTVIVK